MYKIVVLNYSHFKLEADKNSHFLKENIKPSAPFDRSINDDIRTHIDIDTYQVIYIAKIYSQNIHTKNTIKYKRNEMRLLNINVEKKKIYINLVENIKINYSHLKYISNSQDRQQ